MAVVYKGDLLNTDLSDYFSKLETSNNNIANKIDNFCSSSVSALTGNGYDAIRNIFSFYSDALRKAANICGLFSNNLLAANHQLANYMEDLDKIDDALIPETEGKLNAAKADLAYLESYYRTTWTDSEGNSHETWERVGTDAQIAECKAAIEYLEYLLKKMQGLAAADAGAFSLLDAISNDINSLSSAISGISIFDFKSTVNDETDFLSLIDTTGWPQEAIDLLKEISKSWPSDMSQTEIDLIEYAFSFIGKGIPYSNQGQGKKDKNGNYRALDCSSFIIAIFHDLGLFGDIEDPTQYFVNPDQVNTGMFNVPTYTDGYFEEISQNELRPGDICLQERGTQSRGGVHVLMYVGQNANGDDLYIDCSQYYGGGNDGHVHGQLPGLNYDYKFGAIGVRKFTNGKVWYRYIGNQ